MKKKEKRFPNDVLWADAFQSGKSSKVVGVLVLQKSLPSHATRNVLSKSRLSIYSGPKSPPQLKVTPVNGMGHSPRQALRSGQRDYLGKAPPTPTSRNLCWDL